jgi:putative holliday junction resolvase
MALDVGAKRIGVAVAEPGGKLALPVATIVRTNAHDDLARIAKYVESYGVTALVVGDPITLSGERGLAAQKIDDFVQLLVRVFAGPIHRVDERMTTAQATKSLIAADVSPRKRREIVDQVAAVLILESFLARGGSTS